MADAPESILKRDSDALARHALPEMLELLHDDVRAFYPAEPTETERPDASALTGRIHAVVP